MKILCLGCGCKKSIQSFEAVKEACQTLNIDADVEYVDDRNQILEMGVMSTPAIVVNDIVYAAGRILNTKQAIEVLKTIVAKQM